LGLEIPERASRRPTKGVVLSLAEREALVVLDDYERVRAIAFRMSSWTKAGLRT
jgi:hypothetical protein